MDTQILQGSNRLELKALSALSGMDFIIKDYQRGYRWTPVEVERLLDDFSEFVKRPDKKPGEFYCLQPVVVRKIEENRFEVIDGQQRLTTLNLLLQYLSDGIKFLYPRFRLYDIEYSTRPGSRQFLANIKHPETDAEEYIDFYFMNKAYQTIVSWFDNNADDTVRNEILRALLERKEIENDGRESDMAQNIRIIWYEVAEDETTSSVDIFTRLNIGKIPLTDAELVKALFLSSNNFTEVDAELRKIRLSTEWNMIEQHLHHDRFWYFLNRSNNPLKYSSRIEFIFDIISERNSRSPKYHTFIKFQELIANKNAEKVWFKVKQTYNLLNEWYADRELYHIIGYLLEQGTGIRELISAWQSKNKTEFRKVFLRYKVGETIRNINIPELSYNDRADVKKVLLLFNILTVLQKDNSDMRFPFNRFKTEKWDIEHVCSQTDRTLEKAGIAQWCEDILEYYLGSFNKEYLENEINSAGYDQDLKKDLIAVARLYMSEVPDKNLASDLFSLFQKRFNEMDSSIPDKDNIANLALLDYATNRSYGNAFFPIKRNRIIENDSLGIFVPIATKNLFLKYYSPRISNMMNWTEEDANHYRDAIVSIIDNYLRNNG